MKHHSQRRLQQLKHTAVKPHKCDLCESSFDTKSHIEKHALTQVRKFTNVIRVNTQLRTKVN